LSGAPRTAEAYYGLNTARYTTARFS